MSERIRVMQVLPSFCRGGAERMAVHLAGGLDRSAFQTMAVSLGGAEGTDLEAMLGEAGVPLRFLGKGRGLSIRTFARLARLMREFRPHVVHSHLNALLYSAPVARAAGVRAHVYTAHNLVPLLVHPKLAWFYRIALRGWVTPVSIAKAVTADLRQSFDLPELPLIPNGIPVSRFVSPRVGRKTWRGREGFSNDDVLFVCPARLSAQKNHSALIRAFAAGPAFDRRNKLLLAGEGELEQSLRLRAEAAGVADRVFFLGVRADMPELLGACDVFVLASTAEANPLAVLEAMAAGLPAVCTAVGGVPELVHHGEHGYLVPSGDEPALSKAMTLLASRPDLRAELGGRASAHAASRFDVSAMVRAYERLYLEKLGSRSAFEQLEREVPA